MDLKGLPPVFTNFLSYKLNIQGCSPLTVNEYCVDLRCFFRHLISERTGIEEEQVDIMTADAELAESVTSDEVYMYLLYLAQGKNLKPTTRSRKLSSLKAFYKYHTTKARTFQNNPAKDVDAPKLPSRLPVVMTLDEARQLLESFDVKDPSYKRNFLIVLLFLNCGMRLSELAGMSLSDIDSDLKRFVVHGKGGKSRVLYFNEGCREALADYLLVRETLARSRGRRVKDKDALFLSTEGNRISVKTIQWMIKRQLEISGLSAKGFSVHKLRHTAATLMYNEGGVDIMLLKEILGHSQLSTTQIYTHVRKSDVEDALGNNPLNLKISPKKQDGRRRRYVPGTSRAPLFITNEKLSEKYGVELETEVTEETEG